MPINANTPIVEPARDQIVWDRHFVTEMIVNGAGRAPDDSRQIINIVATLRPSRLDGSVERLHPTAPSVHVAIHDVLGAISGLRPDEVTEPTRQALSTAFNAILAAITAVATDAEVI